MGTSGQSSEAKGPSGKVFFLRGGRRRNSYQKPPSTGASPPIPNDVYEDLAPKGSGQEIQTYEGLVTWREDRSGQRPRAVEEDLYVNTSVGAR